MKSTMRLLVPFSAAIAVCLALLRLWLGMDHLSPDGVSYLEIGAAYATGQWSQAINPYWSPLYSWMIAAVSFLTDGSRMHVLFASHVLDGAIYVAGLCSLRFFLRQLIAFRSMYIPRSEGHQFTDLVLTVVGYLLFAYFSLHWIDLLGAGADVCVLGIMCLAAGLLLKLVMDGGTTTTVFSLGLTLAAGYYAKMAMLPTAVLFLGGLLSTPRARSVARRGALAGVIALTLCLPWVLTLSIARGHLTAGGVAKLAYAWYATDVPRWIHWQGDPGGAALHPTRMLLREPALFEFGSPIDATYPPWRDPSYWHAGLRIRPNPAMQVAALNTNLRALGRLIVVAYAPVWVVLAFLILVSGPQTYVARAREYALLLIPSVAACALYVPAYLDSRYVAGPVLIATLCLFAAVSFPAQFPRPIVAMALVLLLSWVVGVCWRDSRAWRRDADVMSSQRSVASCLEQAGVPPGVRVGIIGDSFSAYWAYFAGARIVAEVPSESWGQDKKFWSSATAVQDSVLAGFRRAGASLVVAVRSDPPPGKQWFRLDQSDDYVYEPNPALRAVCASR